MNVRESAVNGMFYPKQKQALERQISGFLKGLDSGGKKSAAIIAPHAGYTYSGKTAAIAFSELKKAETFVILGPNHTGLGKQISVSDADYWETPLGKIQVDSELRKKLLEGLGTGADDLAHLQEHSIEVQVVFLQFLFPRAKILPICIMENNLEKLKKFGCVLAETINEKEVSIVASSDFSHFVPLENARKKDLAAIGFIEKIDVEGFYKEVAEKKLSICGFAPIIIAMEYCRQKGYKKASLLKYDSSATASGDESSVVGYAAIKFEK